MIYGRRNVDQFAAQWRPTRFFRVTFDPVAASAVPKKQIVESAFGREPKEILAAAVRFISDIDHSKRQLSPGILSRPVRSSPFIRKESAGEKVRPAIFRKEIYRNLSCVIREIVQIVIGRIRRETRRARRIRAFHAIPRKSGRHLSRF